MAQLPIVACQIVVCHRQSVVVVLSQLLSSSKQFERLTELFLLQKIDGEHIAHVADLNADFSEFLRLSSEVRLHNSLILFQLL